MKLGKECGALGMEEVGVREWNNQNAYSYMKFRNIKTLTYYASFCTGRPMVPNILNYSIKKIDEVFWELVTNDGC